MRFLSQSAARLALAAALAAAAACSSAVEPGLPPGAALVRTEAAEPVFQPIYLSSLGDSATYAVRTPEAWAELWTRATRNRQPAPPVPAVDFTRDMVLLVAMGTRPNGGFSARIDRVYDLATSRVVEATFVSPGRDCLTPQVITAPLAAVLAPTSALPVRFVVRAEVHSCG